MLRFLFLSICVSLATCVRAQDIACDDQNCGQNQVRFEYRGGDGVCDNETFRLINLSEANLDYIAVDWGDGTVDTVSSQGNPQHRYRNVVGRCSPALQRVIRFTGVKTCTAGTSCSVDSLILRIDPKPVADFSARTEVCVGSEILFVEEACNELPDSYRWDFGDGTTSTEKEPTHTYAVAGVYDVRLTVAGRANCRTRTDDVVRQIVVVDEPELDFRVSNPSIIACAGNVYSFTNASSAFTEIRWSISNPSGWEFTSRGMRATSDSIAVRFTEVGEYEVRLTGQNACGSATKSTFIRIRNAPTLRLGNVQPGCDSLNLSSNTLDYELGGEFQEVFWVFSQGDTRDTLAGEDFGSYTFTRSGQLQLVVNSVCGNLTRQTAITVAQPQPITLVSDTQFCDSSDPDTLRASVTGGTWSGPGIIDDSVGVFDPSLLTPGQATVFYEGDDGICDYRLPFELTINRSQQVTVRDTSFCGDDEPRVLFAEPQGGRWSGPGITDADQGIFSPATVDSGLYRLQYAYTDPNGCRIVRSPRVRVAAVPEVIRPDTLVLCFSNQFFDLRTEGQIRTIPADATLTFYRNGAEVPGGRINPLNDLGGVGDYPITYTLSGNGCASTGSFIIKIPDETDLRIAEVPLLCASDRFYGLTTNLSGGFWSGPGVNPLTGFIDLELAGGGTFNYRYTVGLGQECEQSAQIAVTIQDPGNGLTAGEDELLCAAAGDTVALGGAFPAGGNWVGPGLTTGNIIDLGRLIADSTYLYTYTVTTPEGCTDEAEKRLAYGREPDASFIGPDTVCVDEAFTLSPVAEGVTYRYDFGNGASSAEREPTLSYPTGDQVVRQELTVRTAFGCTATSSREVSVLGLPEPALALDSVLGCAPFTLRVNDPGLGESRAYYLIGADTVNIGEDRAIILNSFSRDSTVDVTLVAENGCGEGRQTQAVTVRPTPEASFGLSTDQGCSPFQPRILNTSFGNPTAYLWDFGNGLTSTEDQPDIPTFRVRDDSTTIYDVRLVARNACGRDTFTEQLTVQPPDVTAFIRLDSTLGCAPFTFRPRSSSTRGAEVSWVVLNAEGRQVAVADTTDPTFTLPLEGEYTVLLRASRCGESTDSVRVTVSGVPAARLDLPPEACAGIPVELSYSGSGLSRIGWQFGPGNGSSMADPRVTFTEVGNQPIRFFATALRTGCRLTVDTTLAVVPPPEAEFIPPPPVVCQPYRLQLSAVETEASRYRWYLNGEPVTGAGRNLDTLLEETGLYDLSLVAINGRVCRDSISRVDAFQVETAPRAAFTTTVDADPSRIGDVIFRNRSEDADTYRWDYGDSTVSSQFSPVHYYSSSGPFLVELIASSTYAGGFTCSDTARQTIQPESLTRFYVPTALSPESGTAEVRLWGAKGNEVAAYRLEVFSPFGQRVFFTDEVIGGQPVGRWNGTMPDGETPAIQGAYTWRARVTYLNGQTENQLGTVTLIR
jgi:PKD repeat protein